MPTTNNASVVAANELDRITNVLTAYDVAPKIGSDDGADGWMPGDPLWEQPRKGFPGEQWTRPMFELFDEREHNLLRVPAESYEGTITEFWAPTCRDCEVSWEGPEPCWVCGISRADAFRQRLASSRPSAGTHQVVFVPHVPDVCAPTVAESLLLSPSQGCPQRRLSPSGSSTPGRSATAAR